MKAVTKTLTLKLRAHLKEHDVRCTRPAIAEHLAKMREMHHDKLLGQVCRECAEIAHRLSL